ncbi:hypothetical protein B5M42_007245 [Paenibacillus athensensis]|uniref:Butirosin biosynthesis protein H N-terminal domain-containing protein n=1 Tax=Paenibacillus athensensis TaxID=1967502 RepID=A0A4Y8Q2D6_9BACL|nr:hypothetical protein [Paenibacillus athensensis]MCD1258627.1 hypothetical protein [Paenibacillus athensensis]
MNGNLAKEYYVRHNGVFDDFVAQLNCFQTALYFVLKNKTSVETPCELFVQDPSYGLELDCEGRFRQLRLTESWQCFEVFQTHDFKGRGPQTLAEIEALLDAGEMVLFETFLNRLPHMTGYIALDFPFEPAKHDLANNHIFVALAHTDTHLYYTEAPILLNANHVPYLNRRDIGMIDKTVLHHATDCFLHYRRVEIKEEGLLLSRHLRVTDAIRSMLANATRPKQSLPDGGTLYYGADALDKLAECCRSGAFVMNRRSMGYESKEGEVLEWRASLIRQQKTMLYRCLERNPELFGSDAVELSDTLKRSADVWQAALSRMRLMLLKQQDDTTALQALLMKMKECDQRFLEAAARWYARSGAELGVG